VPSDRSVTIHGHFYQPPRENPWLEAVEPQDSAAPFHDWNARVTAECYAPNTAARRVDEANRIIDVVNNFERISFDVGPTLMAWLRREASDVYRKIIAADRASVRAHGGHGNAIAQVYNHMIVPLASRRDKVTQVRWGLEDFRARFGREAEGMWLPETAVDTETLQVLAEAGVRFTILAPGQAWRVRAIGDSTWDEVDERIDPSRAYRWRSPDGLDLALFFYDGPISRAIAFEGLLESGDALAARLRAGFSEARGWPQLVHCATDGESYGHHSRFGDMALAAALRRLEADRLKGGDVRLTNYGEFLAANPPTHEVQIHEPTSWSCAHGVDRWRSDCGCRFRPESVQAWRGPLREALDWLRDEIDPFYEARAAAWLKDPWQARDEYVTVVLDRAASRLNGFLARHQRVALDAAGRLETRRLLELQRNRMLMYTSCGWFFDEISGIEPVQIIRYAAIATQYLRDLGGGDLEDEFVRRLSLAPSNAPEYGDGGEVYRRLVRPAVVDLRRVIAHYAITGIVQEHPTDARVYAYRVARTEETRDAYSGTALRIAHVRAESEITGDALEAAYAVLHFGGHDFSCGVRPWRDIADYQTMAADLQTRYARCTLADMVRGMDEHFPGTPYALTDLFLEERRRVLGLVIATMLERHEETYRRIWEDNRKLLHYLRQADVPIPDSLAFVARHVLAQELLAELRRLEDGPVLTERIFETANEARALQLTLDVSPARPVMLRAIERSLGAVAAGPTAATVGEAVRLIEAANTLGVPFGTWGAQNRFFEIWGASRGRAEARALLQPLGEILGFALAATPEP
jgi:alpha-amylase/alpha-mannosidase (GH57 family)